MKPTVRAVTLAAASFTSTVYVSSMSTNTGVTPAKQIASTVGNAVCAGTRISSPSLAPNALMVIQRAEVALVVRTACLAPLYPANSFSNALHSGPKMYWPDSTALMTACLTSSSTGGRASGMDMGRLLLAGVDAAILAAVVEQGLEPVVAAGFRGLHAPHEDRVVARWIAVDDRALELGQRVLEHGKPERALPEVHALELLRGMLHGLGGEAGRYRLMVTGEDIDREVLGRGQGRVAVSVMGDAHQDEGGLERDGGEGAGGETGRPAVTVHGGDDGDARAEVAEDSPEIVGRNHSSLVTVSCRFFNFFAGLDGTLAALFLDGRERRTLYFVQGFRRSDPAPRRDASHGRDPATRPSCGRVHSRGQAHRRGLIGQRWGREVHCSRQPRPRPQAERTLGQTGRRRCLRPRRAAHDGRQGSAGDVRQQDHSHRVARDQDHVDRPPRRCPRSPRLARAHDPLRGAAVPPRRHVGPARLSRLRHAARYG